MSDRPLRPRRAQTQPGSSASTDRTDTRGARRSGRTRRAQKPYVRPGTGGDPGLVSTRRYMRASGEEWTSTLHGEFVANAPTGQWIVRAVHAERRAPDGTREYELEWAGVGPDGRPWPRSWERRENLNSATLRDWERTKAARARGDEDAVERARPAHGEADLDDATGQSPSMSDADASDEEVDCMIPEGSDAGAPDAGTSRRLSDIFGGDSPLTSGSEDDEDWMAEPIQHIASAREPAVGSSILKKATSPSSEKLSSSPPPAPPPPAPFLLPAQSPFVPWPFDVLPSQFAYALPPQAAFALSPHGAFGMPPPSGYPQPLHSLYPVVADGPGAWPQPLSYPAVFPGQYFPVAMHAPLPGAGVSPDAGASPAGMYFAIAYPPPAGTLVPDRAESEAPTLVDG